MLGRKWFVAVDLEDAVEHGKNALDFTPRSPYTPITTGFGGCEAVESDSPIKRNLRNIGGLETGRIMLIP
jgi:hypothetical protein